MPRQNIDEGQIRLLIGAFDYVVEIPDWLVRMHEQNELKFRHSRPRRRIYRITRLLRSFTYSDPGWFEREMLLDVWWFPSPRIAAIIAR
jgi:hypothetical protein